MTRITLALGGGGARGGAGGGGARQGVRPRAWVTCTEVFSHVGMPPPGGQSTRPGMTWGGRTSKSPVADHRLTFATIAAIKPTDRDFASSKRASRLLFFFLFSFVL